jgi:hypothetical protein
VNGEIVMSEKRKKTGGRRPGSKNKATLIGKSVSETLSNWIGLDDAAVERTKMINGPGYRGRLKLKAMWDGERPVDPSYVVLAKFLFAYGFGTPRRMEQPVSTRRSIAFITRNGLPWESDPMWREEKEMLEAQKAERLTEQLAREAQAEDAIVVKKVDSATDAGETLEAVNLPEPEPPSEYRR